jgi:hypothetical protein
VDGNGREGGGVVRASRQRREDQPALHRAEKNRRLRHADPGRLDARQADDLARDLGEADGRARASAHGLDGCIC